MQQQCVVYVIQSKHILNDKSSNQGWILIAAYI